MRKWSLGVVLKADGSRWYLVHVGGSTRRVHADHLIGALDHKNRSADFVHSFEEGNCSLECQSVSEPESQSVKTEGEIEGLQGPEGPVPRNESSKASPTSENESTVAIGSSHAVRETEAGSTLEVASRTLRRSSRIRKPVVGLNL